MPRFKVVIDYSKCNHCGTCLDVCPSNVFSMVEGKVKVVNEQQCLACLACETLCPKKAVSIEPLIDRSKLIDEKYEPPKMVTLM